MGDAGARAELVDCLDNAWRCLRGRSKANLSRMGIGELAIEENRVHALANAKDQMFPTKTLGNALLACDAIDERGDAGARPHERRHRVDGGLQAAGFACKDNEVDGLCFAHGDGLNIACFPVDADNLTGVARKALVVHRKLHGLRADVSGDHISVEKPHRTLADNRRLLDAHTPSVCCLCELHRSISCGIF